MLCNTDFAQKWLAMEQQRALKVVEVCLVAPQQETTTSTTPTSLPLTYFDLLFLRVQPVEHLLFYEIPHSTTSFYDSVLPNLKHSLAFTLQHFLPLAGNITWPLDSPHPIINYVPGDGVSFTIAHSNSNNFNILCSNLCQAVERHALIPRLNVTHDQASVLAIQVTLFPNFGLCIGISMHHGAVDGKSTALFIRAWAYACSKLIESPSSLSLSLPQHLTPFFDRSMIRDHTTIHEVGQPNNRSLKLWESNKTIETDAVKGLFELTPSHIQKLKQYAESKLKMKARLSTFSVTAAHVLTCLVKTEQPKAKRVAFEIAVDCRSRLDPPIMHTYFGNCVGVYFVVAETSDLLGNDGFINALEGIIEALNRIKDALPRPGESWMSMLQPFMKDKMFTLTGSPQFEVYSVNFGWGRPKHVDMPVVDKAEAYSFSESRNNNGGVEIGLTLSKKEMEAFVDHFAQELKSFGCFETGLKNQ